jgi:hypothetical protein
MKCVRMHVLIEEEEWEKDKRLNVHKIASSVQKNHIDESMTFDRFVLSKKETSISISKFHFFFQ